MYRDIVDMLALAHEAHTAALANYDEPLRRNAIKLLSRVLEHPEANEFFGALQLAVSETPFGNDPDVLKNGDGVVDPNEEVDEDSPSSSPAYEGVVKGDDTDQEDMHTEQDDAENEQARIKSVGGMVKSMQPLNIVATAASNWQALAKRRYSWAS